MEDNKRTVKITAVSGSLRKGSYNTLLMRALKKIAPPHIRFLPEINIGSLPFFNPDEDDFAKPDLAVKHFREALTEAGAVILFSPEYAHNISGVLKNALDWVVASGELVNKPVAVVNVSTGYLGGDKAHESLKYLVKLLSANLLTGVSFQVASAKHKFDENGNLNDQDTLQKLKSLLKRLEEL